MAWRNGTRLHRPAHSVCLFVLRWGGWPPWAALLLRTMESNPTVRFFLLGDEPPKAQRWPTNVAFQEVTLRKVLQRTRSALGVATSKELRVDGGGSKISDFKPMLAHLFPELLEAGGYDGGRCDFWGYMQEDQFLGDLRAFLDPALLRSHDVICPLHAPLHHAGPFMVYRNVERVNALYRRSRQWRSVVRSAEYRAFDEWWGATLTEHMPEVVRRESAAGRLRAYVARPDADKKVWLQDDYIYAAHAPKADAAAAAAAAHKGQNESDGPADAWAAVRWYDDSMLLTWRLGSDGVGRLWSGGGSAATQSLWADGEGQRALVHLIGSKVSRARHALSAAEPSNTGRRARLTSWLVSILALLCDQTKRPLRNLIASGDFVRAAARATEFHVSTRGLFLREPPTRADASAADSGALGSAAPSPEAASTASWYSGAFPGAHMLVRPSVLSSSLARLAALGRPKGEGELSARVDALLPCAAAAMYDTIGKKKKRSKKEVAPLKLGVIGCRSPKLVTTTDAS